MKKVNTKNVLTSQEVKTLLEERGLSPRKSLGQNFLVDGQVLDAIISASCITSRDTVIEVGPGIGSLTCELVKIAKKVIAIEKDEKIIPVLKEICGNSKKLDIINDDILNYKNKLKNYKVVANIPYYITSPIIRKFLEEKSPPSLMILTVQREVAKRVTAVAPSANLLGSCVQVYAQPKIVSSIGRSSFWPQPDVTSAILALYPHKKKESILFYNYYFAITKTAFAHPRKQIKKNFLLLDKSTAKSLQLDTSVVLDKMNSLGISPSRRAESVSVEEWSSLVKEIIK